MLIKFKTNAFQIEYAYFYKGFPEVRCNNVNFCQTFFESIKQWVQNEVWFLLNQNALILLNR